MDTRKANKPTSYIEFGESVRSAFLKGVKTVSRAVKATLGPRGRTVMLQFPDNAHGRPVSTKDGVTVASYIRFLPDAIEKAGASRAIEAAEQTVLEAGDGTTTAVMMVEEFVDRGLQALANGANPVALKKQMERAVEDVIQYLDGLRKKAVTFEEVEAVGTISANQDASIGKIFRDALEKVGLDGVVTLEQSPDQTTSLEIIDGYQYDRGWKSPIFLTEASTEVEYRDARVLILDGKLKQADQLRMMSDTLYQIIEKDIPLLIIAEDIDNDALVLLAKLRKENNAKIIATRSPYHGEYRDEGLQDIATYVGTTLVSKLTNTTLADATLFPDTVEETDRGWRVKSSSGDFVSKPYKTQEEAEKNKRKVLLGKVKKVIVRKNDTILLGGYGDKQALENRKKMLKDTMKKGKNLGGFLKESLERRIAKLSGGVAVIRVGGATSTEQKERLARVDDALHATRAALEEGTLPGGGIALLRCQENLAAGEEIGRQVVLDSLSAPLKTIVRNAGAIFEDVLSRVEGEATNYGWNAAIDKYGDMYEMGVLDPYKVVRVALQKAVSIAVDILLTEAIVNIREEE